MNIHNLLLIYIPNNMRNGLCCSVHSLRNLVFNSYFTLVYQLLTSTPSLLSSTFFYHIFSSYFIHQYFISYIASDWYVLWHLSRDTSRSKFIRCQAEKYHSIIIYFIIIFFISYFSLSHHNFFIITAYTSISS